MRDKYLYLRDPRALSEIRKHQWIESQKAGAEIGFATAAIDWVKKYGEPWKKAHGEEACDKQIFLERRKYRRFKLHGLVHLINDSISVVVEPLDLSFFGILCRIDRQSPLNGDMKAHISFESRQGKTDLDCYGRIERVIPVDAGRSDIFLLFNERCQKEIGRALAF